MKKVTPLLSIIVLLVLFSVNGRAQAPSCDASVPFYVCDLRGNPGGTWVSPAVMRNGGCCISGSNCISFQVLLDPNAAMVDFEIASGAIPSGSMYYQIDCGTSVAVGSPICLTGSHYLTFCKPGANVNTYRVTSIPKPTFPKDDSVRIGCSKLLTILGMTGSSITWTSVYPGAVGAYNSYMTLQDSTHLKVTPGASAPPYVDYKICGSPRASSCGYTTACDTVRVYNISALAASVTPSAPSFCAGGSGVAVTCTASGGLAPYTYAWKNSSGTTVGTAVTYTATAAGTYSVEVRDALYNSSLCPGLVKTVAVTVANTPVVNAGPDQIKCASSPVTHLSGSITYATGIWSGGGGTFSGGPTSPVTDYTPTSGEVAAGFVDLILTSTGAGGGCINKSDTIHITYSPLVTLSMSSTAVLCNGGNTGTATASASGGWSPFNYSWTTSPVQTGATATGLSAGTYSVIVTDGHSCSATGSVTVTQPTTLTTTMSTVSDVSCFGGNNGFVSVIPAGGTPPYSYSWNSSPAQTTATATGLTAGTYTVVVTDANSCTSTATATVTQPTLLTASASTVTNVSCNGGNDGSVSVTPSGGSIPWTYSWSSSPAQTSATATGLGAGIYTVTVTDGHSCTTTATATVTEPSVLNATTQTLTNVACNGGNNGSASVTPSGGTSPYAYSWSTSPAQTAATATGLPAGTYTVTVTDAKSCTKAVTATITQPTALSATASAISNVSCNGGSNGSMSVSPTGGSTPYSYSWSTTPERTTAIATGVPAGVYTVTVTDAHSCTVTATTNVTEPTAVSATASTLSNVSCNGGSNGSATVTPAGGTSPYSFAWSSTPVKITATATGLIAGTYTVTVTDAHNCVATDVATITQPTVLTATASTVTNVSCNGGANGSLTVFATGGTPLYTYSWNSSPAQTSATATGLGAGTYTVTVTDGQSCTATATATVTQPTVLNATTQTITNVACNGGNDGSTSVTPSGGTSPYTYSWSTSPAQTASIATGLTAGVYTVTVTDAKSCTKVVTATVTQPSALNATASTVSNVSCNGGSNGSMSVSPTGGTAPYSYSWSTTPVRTTATATGVPAGTYTVTVTDAHSCTVTATANVSEPTALSATASTVANVSCFGGNNGSATVAPSGGTTPYSYAWNSTPVKTTATATGLVAGTYSVTVTDAHNCAVTASTTITQPTVLTASASTVTNVSCNGVADGSVTVIVSGGTALYTYSWSSSPAQTAATATGLPAGTYSVTVTDAQGCIKTVSSTITQPSVLNATASTVSNVACNGGSNGSVSVSPSGGTTPYTYSWSSTPAQTTASATGLTAGTYSVIVTDAHGCTKTVSSTVTQPSTLNATATTISNALCNGINTGSISVSPTGGSTPYTYTWSTSPIQTGATATGLTAGIYTVTVKDSHNCSVTASSEVTQPSTLAATASTVTNVSCNGGNNGSVTVSASGGTTPYSYSWNTTPVQTTATISGLVARAYVVTVTDANGCTITSGATVTQPTALNATTSTLTNVACNGGFDGSVVVNPTGGTSPYTYSWNSSPVQTTPTATGLPAGTYTVVVTDAQSCTKTVTATVTQPASLAATASTLANVSCNGGSNGSVTVAVTGGTMPYGYHWSTTPVQLTATATGLPAGTYMVTVMDGHDCAVSATAVVTEPPALAASASTLTNVSCNGGNNGSVSVIPSGGTSPYTYSWNSTPVKTTATATGLPAGNYTVLVKDAHNCPITATATVTEPTALSAAASTLANVSCNGGNNGSVSVIPSGGTAPYAYSWNSSPSQTSATAVGLTAGTYSVVVTDAHNCTITVGATITQPTTLGATASTLSNVSCNGGSDGSVGVLPSGGTAPYTFAWSTTPAQATATAIGLPAGTYVVTVTDANGCVKTATANVTQPTSLTATANTLTNALCNGVNTGSIKVTPLGGSAPYTYSWSTTPAQTTATATGLTAGTYSVVVTDAHNCTVIASSVVTQPSTLAATASTLTDVSCNGGNDGSVTVAAAGGTSPYSYSWNTSPVRTTPTISGLTAGTYVVTVNDANGCSITASTTVAQPTVLTATAATMANVVCNGGDNGAVSVTPAGGTAPYTYNWSTAPMQTTAMATGLMVGTYTVVVTDAHSCVTTATATVSQPAALAATASTLINVACNGGNDGSVAVVATGGTAPYAYHWSSIPAQLTATATGLPSGTYTVTVMDGHDCAVSATATVTEPTALAATANTISNASCNGFYNGSVSVTASGGTSPYTYSWNTTPVQTSASATGLPAGAYTVTVTDAHNCSFAASTTVTQPTTLTVGASTLTNVLCKGGTDGSASVTVAGGTVPYTYSWNSSPVQTSSLATGLVAGTYTVTVTDAQSCSATATATVTEPTALAATASTLTNVACFGGNDGSVSVVPAGGTAPYSYSWSTAPVQSTATATGLTNGTYAVTVTDAHGCTFTTATTVNQPAVLTATANTLTNALCNGINSGSIDVIATGGSAPYTYSWSTLPVQTGDTATELMAGTYTVTVTDAHNCTVTASSVVTQPSTLAATASTLTNVSCNGGSDGSVTVLATGGTLPYGYHWSTTPIQLTPTATGLAAGTYTVIVMDSHDCAVSTTAVVTEPLVLEVTASTLTNVSCNSGSNGSVTAAIAGGTLPYSYSWSTTPVQTTSIASGLTAGTYTVSVTDAHGCTAASNTTVTEPTTLTAIPSVVNNVSCKSGANASATVTPGGGTTPYSYSWSTTPVQDVATATGLSAGTYTVTVTDDHACVATATVTITEPAALTATASTLVNVSCNGGNNGSVNVVPDGGTVPYTYNWSTTPAQSAATATGLTAGTYTVTVTDTNGCYVNAATTVSEPLPLSVSASAGNILCNGGMAAVTVAATGGTLPYAGVGTYTVSAGTYNYIVTDSNSCSDSTVVTVGQPDSLTLTADITNASCDAGDNGAAKISVSGGTAPYTYQWDANAASQQTPTATNLKKGTYRVTVTDKNGCSKIAVVVINGDVSTMAMTPDIKAPACYSDQNGSLTVNVTGGIPPYTYAWSTGAQQMTIGGLAAGDYSVTVTDGVGCSMTATYTVTQPDALQLSLVPMVYPTGFNVSAYGASDGSVTAQVAGGTPVYTYLWSTGSTDQTLDKLPAGTYSVTVTDQNGCVDTASVVLAEPNVLELPTGYSPNGDGKNDYFVIHGINAYPSNQLVIYNRWGNEVYSADGYHNQWNGQNKEGKDLPDGTYFVVLSINGGSIIRTGYVDLRR